MYDYVIIGSGFGGSVAAMRLAQKGYTVLVVEQGKYYENKDFAQTNWDLRRSFWLPMLRCFGIQKMTLFKEALVVTGVGVGGGSLVYANTHIAPPEAFWTTGAWTKYGDWKARLEPFYAVARQMLGTTAYPHTHREDEVLREVATDMGAADTWQRADVGVYFSKNKTPIDPYFEGAGPLREPCTGCAACLVGCRVGAKNTLDKNYLWFAEKYGATIQAETVVTKIEFNESAKTYQIHTHRSTSFGKSHKKILQTKGVIVCGGVLGTLKLLLQQKYVYKTLPHLSDTLGNNVRTNSESVCAVTAADEKLNNGIALSSGFQADANTYIEVFKYPNGSGVMGRIASVATNSDNPILRPFLWVLTILRQPTQFLRATFNTDFASNSILLLAMQSLDSTFKMRWRRGIFGGLQLAKGSVKVPAYLPVAQQVMARYAAKVNGVPLNSLPEMLLNTATTAHILGGCPMGDTAAEGVINERLAVHNYPNMYVLDGSAIQGNLGVNPSLTITAMAEYAINFFAERAIINGR
jgi:cholesterol oxidase